MKILLVQPPKAECSILGDEYYLFEPLALEYVAAGVKPGHEVKLLDMRLDDDLDGALESFRPDIAGITAYTVNVNTAKKLFDRIKNYSSGILTVVGGHHATVRPQDFCHPSIDLVVEGEGVFVFKKAVEIFESGGEFRGVPGLYRVDGSDLIGEPAVLDDDLDRFPFPDRSISAQYRDCYFSEWMKPLAALRTSKGCPFRCNFCALWKLTGGKHLRRDPAKIVEELKGIVEPYVFFADDESMVGAKNMHELADLIKKEGVAKKYFLYGRSDTIARHPDLMRKWRDIGLERVFVGMEFFRNEDLADINKKTTVEQNAEAVKILHRLGVEVYANFMVRQEFTKDDFSSFRKYCRKLKLNFAGFSVLTPLPGTDFYEKCRANLIVTDWDCFDFIHTVLPTNLPLQEFYREYSKLMQKAVSPWKALSYLFKYPLREAPSLIRKGNRVFAAVRNAYKDHGESGSQVKGSPA